MAYLYRFVTPQAILREAREQTIQERRAQGYRGPIGAIQLDTRDTIKAFLDYFDRLGAVGWIYCGTAEHPDLPYGGCYVFRKGKGEPKKKKFTIRKAETIDEIPLDEQGFEEPEQEEFRDDEIYDLTNEPSEDLLEAPSHVANEILFRQQKVIKDEDPDRTSDVLDELERSEELSLIPKKDESTKEVRHQLYQQFEKSNKNKKAVYHGKETKAFKNWLDVERAKFDPFYKEYEEETGELALKNEKETSQYQQWLKEKTEEKDE